MGALPTGTVTFLFTDIEDSSSRWERYPQTMQAAVNRQEAILRNAILANGGYAYKSTAGALQVAFQTAIQAVQAAIAAQRDLQSENWPAEPGELKVRMALHTGVTEERGDDYVGPLLNRAARLLSAGHGGQVLLSSSTTELLRDNPPQGSTLLDLGEHHLKDLYRPERVFQLAAPGLPSEFPPLKTLDSRPNNLPLQPTPLVGREKEAAEVEELLLRDDVRLLTLTGAGGIGKTRLALQVAADLLDDFKDGLFFVPLAAITDPHLVVPAVAQTLSVRESAKQSPVDAVREYLQDKNMLLVLDNFEQVLDAAPQVWNLLSTSRFSKALVTSRALLRLSAEREYAVPTLSLPDLHRLPPVEQLTRYEGIALFVTRAQSVNLGFKLTPENTPAIVEICARLDGLPLAIELAAARIKIMPPQVMLTRLQSSLRLLTGGARDLPARQQTLRGTIDWSYNLLDPSERQLFSSLSVFAGGFTLEAAEAVIAPQGPGMGGPTQSSTLDIECIDGIASLVEKNLLRRQDAPEVGAPESVEPRFTMLQTVREYALEKLDEYGQASAMKRSHLLYFHALSKEAERVLRGGQQKEWLDRLESEIDNIRAALAWGIDNGELEIALDLPASLWLFWEIRGYTAEGRRWLKQALERTAGYKTAARAMALTRTGWLTRSQGDLGEARALLEQARALWQDLDDKRGLALSLSNLGALAMDLGDLAESTVLLEESLKLRTILGDKSDIVGTLVNLGLVMQHRGNYDEAEAYYNRCLSLSRQIGDLQHEGKCLNNMGNIALLQDDLDRAVSLYEASLAVTRQLKDRSAEAFALANLGIVEGRRGNYAQARKQITGCLLVFNELGDKLSLAECLSELAKVELYDGRPERAALLWGADQSIRSSGGVASAGATDNEYVECVTEAHKQLGDTMFDKAWQEGEQMTIQQTIDYTLKEIE